MGDDRKEAHMSLKEGYPDDAGNAFCHKVCSPVSLSPRRSYSELDSLLHGRARKPIVGWCGQNCGCRLIILHKDGSAAELIAQERCQFSTGDWRLLVGWKFTEWCHASVDRNASPSLVGRSEEGRGIHSREGHLTPE